MPLQLEIVTPEASIYADEVDTVVFPGYEGEMGVLPQHAPLVTLLSAGELRIVKGGKTHFMAVGEGLVEVTGSSARILTDAAIGDQIPARAQGHRHCRVGVVHLRHWRPVGLSRHDPAPAQR